MLSFFLTIRGIPYTYAQAKRKVEFGRLHFLVVGGMVWGISQCEGAHVPAEFQVLLQQSHTCQQCWVVVNGGPVSLTKVFDVALQQYVVYLVFWLNSVVLSRSGIELFCGNQNVRQTAAGIISILKAFKWPPAVLLSFVVDKFP
jgi:hypothetical protein